MFKLINTNNNVSRYKHGYVWLYYNCLVYKYGHKLCIVYVYKTSPSAQPHTIFALESSVHALMAMTIMAFWALLLLSLPYVSCQPFFGSLPPLPTGGKFSVLSLISQMQYNRCKIVSG